MTLFLLFFKAKEEKIRLRGSNEDLATRLTAGLEAELDNELRGEQGKEKQLWLCKDKL